MPALSFALGVLSGLLGSEIGILLSGEETGRRTQGRFLTKAIAALLSGIFFMLALLLRGAPGPSCLRDWGLFMILTAVSVTDLRCRKIPNGLILFGIALWLLWLVFGGLTGDVDILPAFLFGIAAAAVFSGVLLFLSLLADRIFRKETLGGGDIKLIFMVMLHLGFFRGFLCLAAALVSGLIFLLVKRGGRIPWAPSIAIGACTALLLGVFLADLGALPFSA